MERSPSSQPNDNPPSAPFHSQPSDLELVKSYLRPWVDSGVKAGDFIHVADIYAAGPALLARQFRPAVAQNGDRAWYFLTPLHRKTGRGKRKARTVTTGEGWYHNESKSKPIIDALDDRRHVGYRQSFSFMSKDEGGQRVRTGWIMTEIRLGSQQQDQEGDRVLCKVYRSPRYPGEPAAAALRGARRKREADEDESCASPRRKGNTDDDDEEEASDDTAGRRKSDGEGSSAATVAEPGKVDHQIATAVAPGRKGKEADYDGSAETSATDSGNKQRAADDESSVAASAAEPGLGKRKIDDTPRELHCPRCGCHLDAEAVLAAAKSKQETKSGTEIVQVEGDSLVIEHSFHQFF